MNNSFSNNNSLVIPKLKEANVSTPALSYDTIQNQLDTFSKRLDCLENILLNHIGRSY